MILRGMTERQRRKRARRVQARHSQQRLRARIHRTIRAQWSLQFAWRRPVPGFADGGHSKMRPCSSCCSYCRCHSVRALDGAARTLVPMRSQSAMEQVRIETLHPRQMLPSKAASMRRAALPVAARNRPQAARRHRVAAAWCLLRETCCGLSPACRPLQPPLVVRLASDRVPLSRRRASTTSQARNASWWKIRSVPTKSGVWYRRERLLSSAHGHCRRHICADSVCSCRRWSVVC